MLGPKKSRSLNRVDGIITKVRDLKNQHIHPVATLSALSMFIFPREGDQRALVHEANRVAHGKEHVREKDHYSSLRTEPRLNPPPGFLL